MYATCLSFCCVSSARATLIGRSGMKRKKVMGTTEEETRVLDAIKRKEREEREKER